MKKIIELSNKEEAIKQELAIYSRQINLIRLQLKEFINKDFLNDGVVKRINYYQQLFAYYQQDLIPALEEIIRLDKKHLELINKNPDKSFKPVQLEVKNHYKLLKQFFRRFEQVKQEFNSFIINLN